MFRRGRGRLGSLFALGSVCVSHSPNDEDVVEGGTVKTYVVRVALVALLQLMIVVPLFWVVRSVM